MKSFSSLVKEEISKIADKQKLCCAFSELYGMMLCANKKDDKIIFSTNVKNVEAFKSVCEFICQKKSISYDIKNRQISINADVIKFFTIVEIQKIFKCKGCLSSFLKGVFLFYGSVCDPNKMYRLDISLNSDLLASELQNLLSNDLGLLFKKTTRNSKFVLYTKDDETISDFLAYIGANNHAYEVMNSKIEKEIRNIANRMTNCDSANINKALKASQKYCDAIEKIISYGYFEVLPDDLKELALKRVELPSLNLAELGRQINPSISKSCVHHRLERIIQFYERLDIK